MTPWKICKVCNEYKEHHAHGMCGSCYRKERYKIHIKPIRDPTNPESPTYLGCNVAEKVLSRVFSKVKMMPYGNPKYDFICNKGKKIDVKSSCIGKNHNGWEFNIKRNMVADFFLCIAFNDRISLIPLHLWLIPSSKIGSKKILYISQKVIHKWDNFKLDISRTLQCCDEMRD